jgi:transposase-like protein
MASKGQTFRRYSLAFKEHVLNEYKSGATEGNLSKTYDVPKGTIATWARIERKHGGLNKNKKGRPKGTKVKDYKERYEILKKFQDFLDNKEPKKR